MRFRNLLGPANRRYIQTLMVVIQEFLRVLLNEKDGNLIDSHRDIEQASEERKASDFTMSINDFLFELNIDNINLVKLLKYIKESHIMHKVILTKYLHFLLTQQNATWLLLNFMSSF